MNGRVYDPVLGRFLSADPNIDGVEDAQGYNRYSYVGNNPMNATDPSGYLKFKDLIPAIIAIVVTVVTYGAASGWSASWLVANTSMTMAQVAFWSPVMGGAMAGAAGGFASGFSGSLLNGGSIGDAFKAGVIGSAIGAVSGALTAGVGAKFGGPGNLGKELGRALAHGVVGGGIEEARGGEFRHGFYAGFAGSAAGSLTPHLGLPGYENGSASAVAARTTVAAVAGGTASALGGGKFVNGALTAAFQHLLNAEVHSAGSPFDDIVDAHAAALLKLKDYLYADVEYAIAIRAIERDGIIRYELSDAIRGESSGSLGPKVVNALAADPTVVGIAHTHTSRGSGALSGKDLATAVGLQMSISSIDRDGRGEIYRYPGPRGTGVNEARAYAGGMMKTMLAWYASGRGVYEADRFAVMPTENRRLFFGPGALTKIEIPNDE